MGLDQQVEKAAQLSKKVAEELGLQESQHASVRFSLFQLILMALEDETRREKSNAKVPSPPVDNNG